MRVIRDEPPSGEMVSAWVEELAERIASRNEPAIIAHIRSFVPEYDPGTAQVSVASVFDPCRADLTQTSRTQRNGTVVCRKRTGEACPLPGDSGAEPIIAFEN
jgi:hypothetical protein